jgi:predicted nucleic acid-binding protein
MAHFLDSNIICYAFSLESQNKIALAVAEGAIISVQVLNELTNVARRKWGYSWSEVETAVAYVRKLVAEVRPIDEATHDLGRVLAERYQLNIYDSFIVASAYLAECDTLYSEDMQPGLIIGGRLTIRDPFSV